MWRAGATPPTTGGSAQDHLVILQGQILGKHIPGGSTPSKGHSSGAPQRWQSPGRGSGPLGFARSGCPQPGATSVPPSPKGGGGWQPAERGGRGGKAGVQEAEPRLGRLVRGREPKPPRQSRCRPLRSPQGVRRTPPAAELLPSAWGKG